MLKCKDFRHVSTLWVYSELIDIHSGAKSVQALRADYRLDGMLGLKNLRTLRLGSRVVSGEAGTDTLLALGACFTEELMKRCRRVDVLHC